MSAGASRAALVPVEEIADRINGMAHELCRELLPNGRMHGKVWQFSGISDTGNSWSAWCNLSGARIGHWHDAGNAMPGEERGDMLDLLRIKLGLATPKDAIAEAKDRLGIVDCVEGRPRQLSQQERDDLAAAARARVAKREAEEAADCERRAKGARALYLDHQSVPIVGTPAEAYLRGREIEPGPDGQWPGALRYHPEVYCSDIKAKGPAMLAPVYRADGVQIAIHITYLAQRGGQWDKLDVPRPKIVRGPIGGGFIPIAKGGSGKSMARMPEGEPVYMCEGIEDALCIRLIRPGLRVVASINVGNMGKVILPPAARVLTLVCDRDDKPQAQDALEQSIAEQQARGLEVRIVMPPAPYKDINDWWRAIRRGEAA